MFFLRLLLLIFNCLYLSMFLYLPMFTTVGHFVTYIYYCVTLIYERLQTLFIFPIKSQWSLYFLSLKCQKTWTVITCLLQHVITSCNMSRFFFFLTFVELNFLTDERVNCLLFKQLQKPVLEISITLECIKSDYCQEKKEHCSLDRSFDV